MNTHKRDRAMQGIAIGHRLETLQDGLTTFSQGKHIAVPLMATKIDVRILSGIAIVRTVRSFRNAEEKPIEAVMTFPVGFDAVVTGLAATIDGRRMIGEAKKKSVARETYENALDEGRLSVLHEEVLRGIHVLSIGALAPDAEVEVELEQTIPLMAAGGLPFLRLPTTAGQVYGTSPLIPSDDLVTASGIRHDAMLSVSTDKGCAKLNGHAIAPDEPVQVLLDCAIELVVEGGEFANMRGKAADGRSVELSLSPVDAVDGALDLHVIVDRSGSTAGLVRDSDTSIWQAIHDGLIAELSALQDADHITLWQFDSDHECLGTENGAASARLLEKLETPRGGTELARVIRAALRADAKDILVLTDGQTWSHLVEDLKSELHRISAILVGPASLDANIGHLCAMTGGQVLYAPGYDVASALRTAFNVMRKPGSATEGSGSSTGPENVTVQRGGVLINAKWVSASEVKTDLASDAIGRFAAALSLPILSSDVSETWARAHSLCTHNTSLVLVDEVGEVTEGFSQMRKVPLMNPCIASASEQGVAMNNIAMNIQPRMSAPRFGVARQEAGSFASVEPDLLTTVPLSARRRWTGLIPKFMIRSNITRQNEVIHPFLNFAWDAYGDDLLRHNFTILSRAQLVVVDDIASQIAADGRPFPSSRDQQMQARIYALGLIAREMNDRLADRFSRRALRDAPTWMLALSQTS